MFSAFVGSALLGGAMAAEWTIVDGTTATTLVGIGADTDVHAVAAASQNGLGAVLERYDGTKWPKERVEAGLLMDAAVSSDLSVAVSMFPIIVSKDGGATYTTSETLGGVSQDVKIANGAIYATGSFAIPAETEGEKPTNGNGVARSADGGDTWKMFDVPKGYARYGSFPSDDVWYISQGIWGDDPSQPSAGRPKPPTLSAAKSYAEFPLSARLSVGGISSPGGHFHARGANSTSTAADGVPNGWYAGISKTTDGGATWSTVFESDPVKDYFYFNQIDCSSDVHCVAVAEGDKADGGYLVAAYVTADGGETWNNVLTEENTPSNLVSIMSASWVSDTEGWLAATAKQGRQLSTVFFHTTDAGKTFTVDEELDNCLMMDLEFGNGVGYGACMSSSGSSCSVAMYV